MIKSVYERQADLMRALSELYIGKGFHLDPAYNKGTIHKTLKQPELKFDINGEKYGVDTRDCRSLNIDDNFIRSILFDPPFLAGGGSSGLMNEAYSSYPLVSDLFSFYSSSLREFYRILANKGLLVFKCQDLLNGRTQSFSHCEIYNMALEIGFYARDLFILVAKNRSTPHKLKKQEHARKHHCYFWVFEKSNKKNKRHEEHYNHRKSPVEN